MIGMVVGERQISDVGRDVADRGELREQRAQIMVPRGWTIRKQGVIIFTVAISLDFKP